MKIKKKHVNCPRCGKKETWQANNPFKPFCCERCKLIDLGDWAEEKYRVSGESVNLDELDDSEEK